MKKPSSFLQIGTAVLLTGMLASCADDDAPISSPRPTEGSELGALAWPPEAGVNEALAAHQAVWDEPRVVEVSDRVFVAYGYSMCNIIMIVGDDAVAIFDTGFREDEARTALEALRLHSEKPIAAVIYSHGHADHTGGALAFVSAGATDGTRLYAHRNYSRYLGDIHSSTRQIFSRRAAAQLGMILEPGVEGTVGAGGGPIVQFGGTPGYVAPTDPVDDTATIDLGGVEIELFHAPGDLDDALAAWIPGERVLLTGDTAVGTHTHPILSTPRYEKGRDARTYVQTLGRLRDYPAEVMVGGHGAPVRGSAEVAELLARTQMVGQYLIDETLRLTRLNLSGPEVAARLRLPEFVTGGLEFADYYHRLRWIVRGIHAKEMGWFSGDVLDLVSHAPTDRATRWIAAMGGVGATLDRARAAYDEGDPRWAAELATLILQADSANERATEIKANALRAIAYASDSANERNYLLTEANVMLGEIGFGVVFEGLRGKVRSLLSRPEVPAAAAAAPSLTFLQNMGPKLDPRRAAEADVSVEFRVDGRSETHLLRVRSGVVVQERPGRETPDAVVALDHRALVLGTEGLWSWDDLVSDGAVRVLGGESAFQEFVSYFGW